VSVAYELRDKLTAAVRNGDFVAVLDGMNVDDIPVDGISQEEIDEWYTTSVGPHAVPQFEVKTATPYKSVGAPFSLSLYIIP
jgi:hypothetical protein